MIPWSDILLRHIVPLGGALTFNLIAVAPVRDVQKALRTGQLKDLNPTPWPIMLGSRIGWLAYGWAVRDVYLVLATVPGMLLALWLCLAAIKMEYAHPRQEQKTEQLMGRLAPALSTMQFRLDDMSSSSSSSSRSVESSLGDESLAKNDDIEAGILPGQEDTERPLPRHWKLAVKQLSVDRIPMMEEENSNYNNGDDAEVPPPHMEGNPKRLQRSSSATTCTEIIQDFSTTAEVTTHGDESLVTFALPSEDGDEAPPGTRDQQPRLAPLEDCSSVAGTASSLSVPPTTTTTKRQEQLQQEEQDHMLQQVRQVLMDFVLHDERSTCTTSSEVLLVSVVLFWALFLSILLLVGGPVQVVAAIGVLANANGALLFVAPFSTIRRVLQTRSAASLHKDTHVADLVNSALWTTYGLVIHDPFVYVSTALGMVLGLIQLTLIVVLYQNPSSLSSDVDSSTKDSHPSVPAHKPEPHTEEHEIVFSSPDTAS